MQLILKGICKVEIRMVQSSPAKNCFSVDGNPAKFNVFVISTINPLTSKLIFCDNDLKTNNPYYMPRQLFASFYNSTRAVCEEPYLAMYRKK